MKIAGIDLAGNPKNETGFCLLKVNETKIVTTKILHSDDEILKQIEELNPDLVAIDAPLTYSGKRRKCDDILRNYGALPVTLRGMEILAKRGTNLKNMLEKNFKIIEIFSTASAKIIGVYDKHDLKMQKMLMALDLEGDIHKRFLTRDELDSIVAAITGVFYNEGQFETVGNEDGTIIIPKV